MVSLSSTTTTKTTAAPPLFSRRRCGDRYPLLLLSWSLPVAVAVSLLLLSTLMTLPAVAAAGAASGVDNGDNSGAVVGAADAVDFFPRLVDDSTTAKQQRERQSTLFQEAFDRASSVLHQEMRYRRSLQQQDGGGSTEDNGGHSDGTGTGTTEEQDPDKTYALPPPDQVCDQYNAALAGVMTCDCSRFGTNQVKVECADVQPLCNSDGSWCTYCSIMRIMRSTMVPRAK